MSATPASAPSGPPDSESLGRTTRFVRKAITGDAEAQAWLFMHFTPFLRRQALHRLGRLADKISAEDIVSDVWLWALPRLPSIREREGRYTPSLLAYIGARVRGAANDALESYLKRAKREQPLPEDSAAKLRTPNPEAARVRAAWTSEAASDVRSRIFDALDQLDATSQRIFLDRVTEGLSNQEIAEELGEKPNTVAQKYKRARERLAKLLPDSIITDLAEE